tara:strand:+ start:2494 stop:2787 length:294 start_codon:yes stop_codon:yes gene_type:complete
MASKTKKPAKAKSKVVSIADKLEDQELKNVQELQGKIQNVVLNLGSSELAKQSMIRQHSILNEEWNKITGSLEDKYGKVNVNLVDGSLTPIEEESAE